MKAQNLVKSIILVLAGLSMALGHQACSSKPKKSNGITSWPEGKKLADLVIKPKNDGKPGPDDEGPIDDETNLPEIAFTEFGDGPHKFLVDSCGSAGCHGKQQPPVFAVTDPKDSLKTLFETGKIDLTDVSKSRIVKRLLVDEHKCPEDCEKDGEEILALLEDWRDTFTYDAESPDPREVKEDITVQMSDGLELIKEPGGPGFGIVQIDATTMITGNNWALVQSEVSDEGVVEDGIAQKVAINGNGTMTVNVTVDQPGNYAIFVRAKMMNGNARELNVTVGGTDLGNVFGREANAFDWIRLTTDEDGANPLLATLATGINTIQFANGNQTNGIEINQIVLSNDFGTVNEFYTKARTIYKYEFDLKPRTNRTAKLIMELSVIPDTNYYAVERLSLDTQSKIEIKGIEPFINGDLQDITTGKTFRNLEIKADSAGIYEFDVGGGSILGDKGIASDELGIGFYSIK